MEERTSPPRLWQPAMATPLAFMALFIFCIYGMLLVGLSGVANWIIHVQNLTFFLELGRSGIALIVFCLLAAWFTAAFGLAAIPYYILRLQGRYKLASKAAAIILLLLFNIFMLPFILWPMVRNASPRLRRNRQAKLKKMAEYRKIHSAITHRQ